DGLAREEIPLGARVFAIADALDAITSDRPYRKARTWEFARIEITHEVGLQFDPAVGEVFLEAEPALREIAREFSAA
ncbi:MAG: two-component system response regulator, partial [Thermoleophilia bacterium]|nr:two-component system response regulator [Thermoleophilia bacterium]